MSLAGQGRTSGSSLPGFRSWLTQHPDTLSWASGLLFRGFPSTQPLSALISQKGIPRGRPSSFQSLGRRTAPPLRFLPLQRLSTRGSGFFDWACLTQSPASSGFGQPPDAFIRPELTGPISYRIRSWGLTLQSFVPPGQPYVVSNVFTLLTLDLLAFS
jgi:hypothetical protein